MSELIARAGDIAAAALRVAGWEVLFSAVLFVIVLGLTRALRTGAPALRHALWGLVLLRLVLPVDLALPFSLGALAGRAKLAPAFEPVGSDAWPGSSADQQGAAAGDGSRLGPPARASGIANWELGALVLWLAGASGLTLVLLRRRRSYRAVVRRASTVDDPVALALLQRWRDELRIRRAVRVVTSDDLHVPFTLGAVRPVIFVPRAILEPAEPELVESVLAHELAHIRRGDDLWLRVQLLVSTLYFFNPVTWLSLGKMQEESERACDELVLSRGRLAAKAYGRSLVTVLSLGLAHEPSLAPALMSRRRRMKARLETIMSMGTFRKGGLRAYYPLPVAAAVGLVLLPMARTSADPTSRKADLASAYETSWDQAPALRMSSPMPGARISAAWGPMVNPFTGEVAHHRGIDLVGRPGSEIQAAAAGVVEEATADYARGKDHGTVVIIDHGDGIKTFYSHLDRLAVRRGQRVAEGDVLGTQGPTGKVTGAHLHFEVWENGEFRDPALFVGEWRIEQDRFQI